MKFERIRVLVVSYLPWRNDVSVGNTLSNLFDGLQDRIEFANIYFKGGKPQNDVAEHYFYISEAQLAKSIFMRKAVGTEIEVENRGIVFEDSPKIKMYNKARQIRWESMLLAQDIIGVLGVWKSKKLDQFIRLANPDIVFGPLGRVPVANALMRYIHDEYNIPVVAYAWDDHYSLKKKSYSPFFWIKTFFERRYIKKTADVCEFLYTITLPMMKEYHRYFNKECKLLYKGYDFSKPFPEKYTVNSPMRIIYMGNVGAGRWKVLAKVASVISEINKLNKKAELLIYTLSPLSEKMKKALTIDETSRIMNPVPNEQVLVTMKSADILLHVEPTNEKNRLFFRLSFSTKIVDYLYNARCILAIGGHTAAMDYLIENDAAVVVLNEENLKKELERLINDDNLVIEYGKKAWQCGIRNHQKKAIQDLLYKDFMNLKMRKASMNEN